MAITSRTVVEGSRRIPTRLPTRGPRKEAIPITISGNWCPGSPRDKYRPPFRRVFDVRFHPLLPTLILAPLTKMYATFSSILASDH